MKLCRRSPTWGFHDLSPTSLVLLNFSVDACSFWGFSRGSRGLLLAGEMVIALWRVHGISSNPRAVGHYEFPLVLAVTSFAIASLGAGLISFDHALFREGRSSGKAKKNS